MRKIKFRAWHKDKRTMHYPGDYTQGYFLYQTLDDAAYVVMQYAGKNDSNGKEIYEGDILSYSDCPDSDAAAVYYEGSGFRINSNSVLYMDIDEALHHHSFQVIGNIYEHPDIVLEGV